jgi:hypothetical protein
MINFNESIIDSRFTFRHSSAPQLNYTPGIWVNGKYAWIQNCSEKILYEDQIILKVKQEQIHSKIQLNHVFVSNHSRKTKKVKILALHHHSQISQDHFTFASPRDQVIFHYNQEEMFLVNGQFRGAGMKEYTIHPYWNVLTDKIWSCLDKGCLKYQPMAKGPAASIFTIEPEVKPHETIKLSTWVIKGENKRELMGLNQALLRL